MSKKRVHHVGSICASIILILSCIDGSADAMPALQQTVPPGGVAVCPLSTVQYTCVADDNVLVWREFDSATPITYTTFGSKVNDTGVAGVFMTVLTSISGTTLTSTATIDGVSLEDDGRNISCADISGAESWQVVQVEDTPPAPSNLTVTKLSEAGSEVTVNLTWSQNDSRCVVMYHVEVTSMKSFFDVNTTKQHVILPLQIGVVYSFRVRGADTTNRLGEWSDSFVYNSSGIIIPSSATLPTMTVTSSMMANATTLISSTTPSPLLSMSTALLTPILTATPSNHSAGGLTGGAIAGIVVGASTFVVIVIVAAVIGVTAAVVYRQHRGYQEIIMNDNAE